MSTFGFGGICALLGSFLVDVETLRADSIVEVAKFRLSDVDLDCAVFGLFNAGSEGLCLILLILQQNVRNDLSRFHIKILSDLIKFK